MKILVLSDSHASLRFMRSAVLATKPDAVIHLGDYYDDGETLAEENPNTLFYQVPGNCDRYRCPIHAREILCLCVGGVRLYMTHGHRHGVKSGLGGVISAARSEGAQAALFGHTHEAVCFREPDGLWVLNPGSCGHAGGSAGVIETRNKEISACYLIGQADVDALLKPY